MLVHRDRLGVMESPFFIVVGGGVVGLSLARELAGRGARVTLLERDAADAGGRGTASTASLGILVPPNYRESAFGRLLRYACGGYESLCREIADETGIDPGYRALGGLHLVPKRPREKTRERALESYQRAGITVEWLEPEAIAEKVPGVSDVYGAGLYILEEALVHPPSLLEALRKSCQLRGVELEMATGEARLELDDGPPRVLRHDGEPLQGGAVIVAAGAWTTQLLGKDATESVPVVPIRGQALEVALDLGEAPIVHFAVPGRAQPYYVLPKDDARAWVGATVEDVGFAIETSPAGISELERALSKLLPAIEAPEVLEVRAGLRPRAERRGGPFLGPVPGHTDLWVAGGHYNYGILAGPLSARLLAVQLLGETPTRIEHGLGVDDVEAFWPRERYG